MSYSIENILLDLISIQSDTGTSQECDMENYIFNTLKSSPYFLENPNLLGLYGDDTLLNRHVVWALKDNNAKDTIILVAHHDAAPILNYGILKDYALAPSLLKEKLKTIELDELSKEDLDNPHWLWGRGSCDMKAGIAINLHTILTNTSSKHNILFLSVPDEENISFGMRAATSLLFDLKEKHNLNYKLLLLTEPHVRESLDTFNVHCGSVGKIMPLIFVKGKLCHVSEILNGFNPIPLLCHLINTIDLNPELCFQDKCVTTSPPTILGMTDLRESYDVSIPEFGAAYFNMNFLRNSSIDDILKNLLDLCIKGTNEYSLKLKNIYKTINNSNTELPFETIEVLSYNDFKKLYIDALPSTEELIKGLYKELYSKLKSDEMNLQESSIYLISKLVSACNINHPLVIIGAIPPYYSAVHNDYLMEDATLGYSVQDYLCTTLETIKNILLEYNLNLNVEPYFMGISDLSYTSCSNPMVEAEVMRNLITLNELYNIDFNKISSLNIPAINIGPFGRDLHQNTERVYMPDVLDHVPEILNAII